MLAYDSSKNVITGSISNIPIYHATSGDKEIGSDKVFKNLHMNNVKEKNKLKADKVVMTLKNKEFLNLIKMADAGFNFFGDINTKKALINICKIGNPFVSIEKQLVKDVVSNETNYAKEYSRLMNQDLVFEWSGTFLSMQYVLVIFPISIESMDVVLVPKDLFDYAKNQGKIKDLFYYAFLVDLANSEAETEDVTTDRDVYSVSATVPVYKISEKEYENLKYMNTFNVILRNLSAYGNTGVQGLLKAYRKVISFLTGQEVTIPIETAIGKLYGATGVFVIRDLNPHGKSVINYKHYMYNTATEVKDVYYYGDIPFPIYLESKKVTERKFNIVTDSTERNRYGFFTKNGIDLFIKPDEPLDEDFDYFFGYDYEERLDAYEVSKKDLPYNDFKNKG